MLRAYFCGDRITKFMRRGVLVTFEGTEGCGKTTQLHFAAEWLMGQNLPYFVTREPGGTDIGKEIRRILLSEQTVFLAPISETLLYLADRFQHIAEVLKPHLAVGQIVLCDRYHDSTIAYQGYAREIPLNLLDKIWNDSGHALEPDLTLLFDVEPQVGIARSLEKLKSLNLDESRFEKEAHDFHARVRQGFLRLADLNAERIRVINANGTMESVRQETIKTLQSWLKEKKWI